MKEKQGIGQLLLRLREKEKIRQKQLCRGLCSNIKYVRIDNDQQETDFFLIDRLMGRMGKSVERLTYVLPVEVYEIYELRREIQQRQSVSIWKRRLRRQCRRRKRRERRES